MFSLFSSAQAILLPPYLLLTISTIFCLFTISPCFSNDYGLSFAGIHFFADTFKILFTSMQQNTI